MINANLQKLFHSKVSPIFYGRASQFNCGGGGGQNANPTPKRLHFSPGHETTYNAAFLCQN